MNSEKALSWLLQPGLQSMMDKYDRHTKEAIEISIQALKKQVPASYKMKYKETVRVEIDEPEDVDVFTFHCPCCDQELGDSDWDGMPTNDWLSYCDNCGQKIDWMHDVDVPEFEREKNKLAKKIIAHIKGESK